jgi:uncharacterized membrane protein (Fun14 family)
MLYVVFCEFGAFGLKQFTYGSGLLGYAMGFALKKMLKWMLIVERNCL